MTQLHNKNDELLWKEFVDAYNAFTLASLEFYSKAIQKVALVKSGIRNPTQRQAALRVAEDMKLEEKQELFSELLEVACFYHGLTQFAQKIILSLPHDWLLENIERYAEPILQRDDYEEYRGLLHLYVKIDTNLTKKLVERALKHDNLDIREAGEDFQKKLSE
jgi:hypothetical protein